MTSSNDATASAARTVSMTYFSDVLCIWAYIAQLRLEFVTRRFGDLVRIDRKFCSVFADTERKITTTWRGKGEHRGFNAHLLGVAARFPEVPVHRDIWLDVRPPSSMSVHLFIKAANFVEVSGRFAAGSSERLTWAFRRAFFERALDISLRDVQCEVARSEGLDPEEVDHELRSGRPYALLASDYQDAEAAGIRGSPSFVLNEGRQKLYGNVGYRLLEANIQELLREPDPDQASWC